MLLVGHRGLWGRLTARVALTLVEEVYEKNNLHVDARFVNYDDFTGLQASALFKAIESMGYFVSAGASTSLTNKWGFESVIFCISFDLIKLIGLIIWQ